MAYQLRLETAQRFVPAQFLQPTPYAPARPRPTVEDSVDVMKHLDMQVVDQAVVWLEQGKPVWLSTVLATFGSAPREPGSMLVALSTGKARGSLSGGCVEEDFLERVALGQFHQHSQIVRYGEGGLAPTLALPCGGVLDVLVEYFPADMASVDHFKQLAQALKGQVLVARTSMVGGNKRKIDVVSSLGPKVQRSGDVITINVGPAKRLIIAGMSPVAEYCASFAFALGFEVVVCDPRPDEFARALDILPNSRVLEILPAVFIEQGGCHAATAVVALTHDPRLDDLTLMEAVRTQAFYIGAMGSSRTSAKRLERLGRIGGLNEDQKLRIHAPIGLNIGSKTPAEIAISVVADILRAGNGVAKTEL